MEFATDPYSSPFGDDCLTWVKQTLEGLLPVVPQNVRSVDLEKQPEKPTQLILAEPTERERMNSDDNESALARPFEILSSNELGLNKGIQGDTNSCYIDAVLMALFLFNKTLDHLLKDKDNAMMECLYRIVQTLRTQAFVSFQEVSLLRKLLDQRAESSWQFGMDVQDAADFIRPLMCDVLKAPPLLKLRGGEDETIFVLFPPIAMHMKSVQEALEAVFQCNYEEYPVLSSLGLLFLQIPRSSEFSYIYPSNQLCWPLARTEQGVNRKSKSGIILKLQSVISIETSHFVAFMRDRHDNWYFSDSMARREYDTNIPELTPCPEVVEALEQPEKVLARIRDLQQVGHVDPLLKRFVRDAFILVYQAELFRLPPEEA